MASLGEIRAKYPEYGYLSDNELADALHKKFYSDMPRDAFDKRLGLVKEPPRMSASEAAVDVAKSAGVGLAQGAIGLATLPGNVEALARAGINAGAGLVGVKPPVDADTFLTNYNDAKGRVEKYTGEFYKPKTTIGEYARTAGEFAPLAIGGGAGLAAKAPRVLVPAVASETAGQMTEGTSLEPWARAGAALAATRAPNVGARMVTPSPADPARAAAIQTLEREGVGALTAGQRTGSNRVRWIEDATAMVPGGGGRATAMQTQAAEQFTRAALRRAGINADRATTRVMDQAFDAIGREYNRFAIGNNLTPNPMVAARIQRHADRYESLTPNGMQVGLVRSVSDDIANRIATNGMSGQEYLAARSNISRAARELKSNPQASRALNELVETLDAHLVRSAPQGMRQRLANEIRDRNTRYRNLLAIEDAASAAGEGATSGLISPALLRTAVKKQNKREYVRGRHPMADLARSGSQVLTPLKSSGTAERSYAQGVVSAPGAVIGGVGGGSIEGALIGGAAPWLARAATARGLMSRPIQNYLANQSIPRRIDPQNALRVLPYTPFQLEREDQ